ncbi:MAG TPA: glycoside hydrolase family 3 N-terminal domain-containing protein [Anaerolineales bacterium]|nr:glycoside hydrolase family 3 N-terminal domain-containing protein [Anaerolineales bacterium]
MQLRIIFRWILPLTILASLLGPLAGARAQTQTPPPQVQALLDSMTPEERVGQLFLVTFNGTDTSEESQIYDLIANQHVGGVILQAENDNFISEPNAITSTYQLINVLQNVERDATIAETLPRNAYVPLFVGISQEGDGFPNDQILSSMTPLPNEMAIGATWNTENATKVGSVLGSELSAIGFNFYLGPSLDVVESPNPSARSDLGTRVFGGDPFWVGEMGQAYIAGLHQGSNNRMIVVAKHFPGSGGSDRSPEEDVSTVRKSLEQLKQIELPPFFAVTNSTNPTAIADGLLVSHIRYQGFQGNIRATTRPVSFDASALSAILALPQLSTWRDNGGLMISDDLGSDAVRAFYSSGGENFLPRLVARDAFLAGNDLLYLGNIISNEFDNTYEAALRILSSFSQEYRNDPVFAQKVDAAVARILTQKLRMYPTLNINDVISSTSALESIGSSEQVAFDIARDAATLISPDQQELNTLLPAPPITGDRIVFLTDVFQYSQCSTCPVVDSLAVDSFENTVLRLFGPSGSGQVFRSRVSSFSLSELELLLEDSEESNIESALSNATWIVISLSDVSQGQINVLRRFFLERPNLIRNRNVILFSFTAPYYLDATDISKLTAYYAVYSKQPAFVDAAARILFQQATIQGTSPVSIPAVGYDLIEQTSPDPEQIIALQLDREIIIATEIAVEVTPEPTEIPSYKMGDSISVRAGPVLDHNHHLVPDGTVVRFTMTTRDESGGILQQVDVTTQDGMARASFVIDKPGNVEINAVSEPAMISDILQFDATDEGVAVTFVPIITETPVPSSTPTPTDTPENNFISPDGYPRSGIWFLVLLGVFGSAALTYWAVSRVTAPLWGVRFALNVLIGGFGAYNYLALGFPRAQAWISSDSGGAFGVLLFTLAGEALGIILAWIWFRWLSGSSSQAG